LALFTAGIHPLSEPAIRACRPLLGCLHLYLLVEGHLTQTDVSAALLPLAVDGTLPAPVPLPPYID
jgi:hypothetical protein